ncbi:MAG: orotidine-5'-phosphate decarboxylase [Pseudomonadota bacterium]
MNFSDRVIVGTARHGPLCVGIDPHAGRIPDLFGGDTPGGIAAWGEAIIEIAADKVAAIKPQVGLFERHGPEGVAALQRVCRAGREAGLLVIADAKRGDIGSTAEGYAAAYLEPGAPFEADALTVNPYMGMDTLSPFVDRAAAHGKGVVVLARTSNPGSADFQSKDIDGQPLYARVVQALEPMIKRLEGAEGWSSLMLVTGATGPDEARSLRRLAPEALFLVPGYGAQGAGAADAVAGFVNGKGGLVNASRSVTFPEAATRSGDITGWQNAIEGAMIAAQTELKQALGELGKRTL